MDQILLNPRKFVIKIIGDESFQIKQHQNNVDRDILSQFDNASDRIEEAQEMPKSVLID